MMPSKLLLQPNSKEKWNSLTNAEQTKLIYDQIKIMDKMPLDKIRVSPEIEA